MDKIYDLKQLKIGIAALVMSAQPSALSELNLNVKNRLVRIEDKSQCDKLEAENAPLRNQVGQMAASAEYHTNKRQDQWNLNKGRNSENSREHAGPPPRSRTGSAGPIGRLAVMLR